METLVEQKSHIQKTFYQVEQYTVIFFLTWDCNLKCSYCYEKNRNNKKMSWEIAKRGIDFFMQYYKHVTFQFFGGEPLLQFELIKKIIKYLEENYEKRYGLSLFTNGTLINEEVLDYILKKRIHLTLSMDGKKETQDKNRVYKNGDGTFDRLYKLLKDLSAKKIPVKIRLTATPDNCQNLFENISYFYEEFGFNDVQDEVDRFVLWEEGDIDKLINEYNKIVPYLINEYKKNKDFNWKNFETRIYPFINQSPKFQRGRCGSSKTMCSMDVNGDLYPCQKFIVNQKMSIGSIFNGYNEKQREIVSNYILPNVLEETRGCRQCDYVNYCFAGCIADNLLLDTDQFQDCKFRRLHKSMHKKFYDAIIENNLEDRIIYNNGIKKIRANNAAGGCGSEHSCCGSEGGGCGSEAGGCGSEAAGCGSEGGGCGSEAGGCGSEGGGCGSEAGGCGSEAGGCGSEGGGCGSEAPGCGSEGGGCGSEAPGCGSEAGGCGSEGGGCGSEACRP